uniref:Uncharacterized protein n=1 Tax=viral metagenome TaxID=1070528 RepID=A0A6M3MDL0_9ZZZZ
MTQFVEVSRVKVSDSTEVVLSQVIPNNDGEVSGVNINTYITSDRYTGFTKGVFIPTDKVEDFKKLVAEL